MMKLIVNGKAQEHAGTETIPELLEKLGAKPDRVALTVNGHVVRRDDWHAVRLRDGDRVELLTLTSGG